MIENLSEREKSAMLARMMGWEFVESPDGRRRFCDSDLTEGRGGLFFQDNLYDPTNMALAWRVLNWWRDINRQKIPHDDTWMQWLGWLLQNSLWMFDYDKAQAAWLDKILSLAIEAGIVEVENV